MRCVSIIVPVYNVEQYLAKCLDSLVNQTLSNIEIIVVNDGSTDNSESIIYGYQKKYPEKLTYIKKSNGGLSSARNLGIQYASGEYIGCIDSDDYADITMFEKMYNKAKNSDADFAECDYYHEYADKLIRKTGEIYELKDMLIKARTGAWNKIIKRDIIKNSAIKYPIGLRYEDVEYFYKIVPYITKIGFVKEPLYYYVQRVDSICHTQNEKTRDIFQILQNVIQSYKDLGLFNEYKNQLEYIYLREILGSSFFRMIKIKDKKLRNRILRENWQNLNSTFPNWYENIILKRGKSLKDIYFKTINIFTYKLYSKLFNLIDLVHKPLD
jgi:glycosyltransferase involved in cell wall biosynthesis